ncbi:hypothetical protein PRK78_002197 [Emydomyces testavorans]|uniref:Signal peptide peptidase n=1 Tax=Emydomyces testavorans TaxID=2070801 RepID=A0AAF0DDQ7_9EURO|nr:hypothetical protein PRK78_002197 [Emydomyces testavorans]
MSLSTSLSKALDSFIYGFDIARPIIPTYIHLLISALFCIYIGAHASLSRPSSAAQPAKKKKRKNGKTEGQTDDEEETDDDLNMTRKMEGLQPSDAIMFPVLSGLTLGGLYLLLKHFDPAVLNKVLNWYFSYAGFLFTTAFVRDGYSVLRSFVFPEHYAFHGSLWKADQEKCAFTEVVEKERVPTNPRARESPLPGILGAIYLPRCIHSLLWAVRGALYETATLHARIGSFLNIKAFFTIVDVLSINTALCTTGYAAFVARPWWLINFLGFSFAYGALQLLSPTTFATGSLILSSLFFYDIYFVFYTPMMVTVAQGLDLPIKLLFPRPPTSKEDPSLTALAMLGLGDIVLPGIMIGLALRFDLYLHYLRKSSTAAKTENDTGPRPKYVTATGGWGERFWISVKPFPKLPEKEATYHEARSFRKTYFKAGLVGYVLGMLATLVAMQISNHPQPALLYLVPGVLSSIWLTALIKGDISVMWNFSDSVDDEDKKEDQEKAQNKAPKEREKVSVKERFKQFLFGADKPGPADRKEGSNEGSQAGEIKVNKAKKPDELKEKRKSDTSSVELVSFSISLQRKKRREKAPLSTLESQSVADSVSAAAESDSTSSSPVLVEKASESPLKKRRTR